MSLYKEKSLLPYNTFGMNVVADYFFEYSTIEELKEMLASPLLQGKQLLQVGCGSNLLFLNDFHGVVFHSALKGIAVERETENEIFLRAQSGEVWDDVVRYCVEHGWGGVENLSIIPGTVGASVVQNIGAYGVEAKDVVASVAVVEIATGAEYVFSQAECEFAYRKSAFKTHLQGKYVVTSVLYQLKKNPTYKLSYGKLNEVLDGKEITLQNVRNAVIDIRRSKLPDPAVLGNAGSFFMNPVVDKSVLERIRIDYPEVPSYEVSDTQVKIPAGWLIEKTGWKGRALGRAAVHDKQALVLVNCGGATPQEVVALSNEVVRSVYEKFCIKISPEVIFVG